MIPGPLAVVALRLPSPAPVPLLAGGVQPRASRSFNHIAGLVSGARVLYADLSAFSWYTGQAGRELRGPRVPFRRAGLRGAEDHDKRKQ